MRDQPVLAVPQRGVVRVVLHPLFARAHYLELGGGILERSDAVLGSQGRRGQDVEEALRAVRAHADAELLVLLLEDQDVLGCVRAHLVAPDLVGPPGVVAADVEQVVIAGPGRAVEDALDDVREQLAGLQVLDAQVEALVAGGVHRVGQEAAGGGDRGGADGEEFVAFGELVGVDKHLLPGHLLRDLGWGPGVVGGGDAAREGVVLALDGAAVVPPVARALRHGHIRFLHARLDLAVDRVGQIAQERGGLLSGGVFRLQVRDRLRAVFVAQPLVVVHEVAAVERAGDRVLRCLGEIHRHPA